MKFTINEDERKQILEQHNKVKLELPLLEQDARTNQNKAIQCFLNKKGIRDKDGKQLTIDGSIGTLENGSKTAQAIEKYQNILKVRPDGVWGEETRNKMPENDKKLYQECLVTYGDFIDKGMDLLKRGAKKLGF
jgi:hypothetical protein